MLDGMAREMAMGIKLLPYKYEDWVLFLWI